MTMNIFEFVEALKDNCETTAKPTVKHKRNVVFVGRQVVDLNDSKWHWLKGYDYQTKLFILQGITND